MFKQVSGKKESTAFNNIVDLLYHAILLHYGLGGRQRFEENGAQLSLFGEKLLTHHLSVGTSLTHNRKNKNKATGHTRCFLGAAIRVINSELYAAFKSKHDECSGGFRQFDKSHRVDAEQRFLMDCPGCLDQVIWHGSCAACLCYPHDKDADLDVKIHLSCHGRTAMMESHNYKRHTAA